MMDLQGKVAAVTGEAGNIGHAMSRRFGHESAASMSADISDGIADGPLHTHSGPAPREECGARLDIYITEVRWWGAAAAVVSLRRPHDHVEGKLTIASYPDPHLTFERSR